MSEQLPDPLAHWRQRFDALKVQMDALEGMNEKLTPSDFQRRLAVFYHQLQAMADEWKELTRPPDADSRKDQIRDWSPRPPTH